uniref:Uncharacterized protein n=1 Tax=Arundo donax TaxID=35708 RepID=A0A0A9B1Z2_ARUDO
MKRLFFRRINHFALIPRVNYVVFILPSSLIPFRYCSISNSLYLNCGCNAMQ